MIERAARQARIDRNAVSFQAEMDISKLFLPLSHAVGDSVQRHAGEAMTPLARVLILRDVDAALASVRGRFPGDREAPLYRLVVRRCLEGRALVFRRAVEDFRRKLRREPEVLAAIEGEAT
jgi:hypothetical protein